MGSSRSRKKYSMMDTTSGMLARKQMMVSTGTYCAAEGETQARPMGNHADSPGWTELYEAGVVRSGQTPALPCPAEPTTQAAQRHSHFVVGLIFQ